MRIVTIILVLSVLGWLILMFATTMRQFPNSKEGGTIFAVLVAALMGFVSLAGKEYTLNYDRAWIGAGVALFFFLLVKYGMDKTVYAPRTDDQFPGMEAEERDPLRIL